MHSFFPFAYDGKEAKGGIRRETMEKKRPRRRTDKEDGWEKSW